MMSSGQVNTGGSRWTSSRCAVIDVFFAIFACESWRTDTLVIRTSIVNTGGSILTSILSTSVIFILASNASISIRARAIQTGSVISAESTVHARRSNAPLRCRLAPFTINTFGTDTEVIQEQINTFGIVLAGVRSAEADIFLAPFTGPTGGTGADKSTDFIGAPAAIHAGVGCTIVYVGLTEFSHEAFSAFTFEFVV